MIMQNKNNPTKTAPPPNPNQTQTKTPQLKSKTQQNKPDAKGSALGERKATDTVCTAV